MTRCSMCHSESTIPGLWVLTLSVISVAVAENLPCSNSQIFLNLVTKENKNFTVALNPEGFKIVGFGLDTIDTDGYDDHLLNS